MSFVCAADVGLPGHGWGCKRRGGVSTCAGSRADSGLSPQGWVLTQLLCLFLALLETRGISWGSEAVAVQQESAIVGFGRVTP